MTYDLEAFAPTPRALDPADLVARARALVPALAPSPELAAGGRIACDGSGFAVEPTARGAYLSADASRGPVDERAMEAAALAIAGDSGSVVDRHTGRQWSAPLLREWLAVSALLSGRALAVNEGRIAHRAGPAAVDGFASRVDALARHVAEGGASRAMRARLVDELSYYATRPALAWPVARGLAALGDFARLEALARAPLGARDDVDAFAVAADYGAAALPLFARALSDADPNYRRAAARSLHRVKTPEVLPLVARALEDKRSTVREAVLESGFDALLALEGGRRALAPLMARLANDPSSLVRRLAARYPVS